VPSPPLGCVLGGAWPVVESCGDGTSIVTFVRYAPHATGVLLFVNRLTDERNLVASEMEPAGELGFWLLSYRMHDDWRASYSLIEHPGNGEPPWRAQTGQVQLRALLDAAHADPGNPLATVNKAGHAVSVVELPAAPPQAFVAAPGAPRPQQVDLVAADGSPRPIWTHRAGSGVDLPLVMILDGETWLDRYSLTVALDAAVAAGALPALQAVFVGTGSREQRWDDVGHAGGVTEFVARTVVPWARSTLDVSADPVRTVIAGQSLGGLSALWALAAYPDVIGSAVAQSASLWSSSPVSELRSAGRVRLYLEVGRQEWLLLPLHRELRRGLISTQVDLRYVEYNGGHDYACWRGGLIDGLAALLEPGD